MLASPGWANHCVSGLVTLVAEQILEALRCCQAKPAELYRASFPFYVVRPSLSKGAGWRFGSLGSMRCPA